MERKKRRDGDFYINDISGLELAEEIEKIVQTIKEKHARRR